MAASEPPKSLVTAAELAAAPQVHVRQAEVPAMARNSMGAAVAVGLAVLAVPGLAASPDRYTALVYDFLLLRQCGLADRTVENGFRLAVHELTGDGDAEPDAYAAARDAGVARYESEVRNRGSGAADPRCRTDAVAAAGRFRAVIDAE